MEIYVTILHNWNKTAMVLHSMMLRYNKHEKIKDIILNRISSKNLKIVLNCEETQVMNQNMKGL